MSRLTKDEYFLAMLELVSARSTCPRRLVGAIITDDEGRILATGYNGVPSGFDHCVDVPCAGAQDQSGNTSRCEAVHAEANAVLQCWRLDLARTIYVSVSPCFECAKLIANTPIRKAVLASRYVDRRGEDLLRRARLQLLVRGEDVGPEDDPRSATHDGLMIIARGSR